MCLDITCLQRETIRREQHPRQAGADLGLMVGGAYKTYANNFLKLRGCLSTLIPPWIRPCQELGTTATETVTACAYLLHQVSEKEELLERELAEVKQQLRQQGSCVCACMYVWSTYMCVSLCASVVYCRCVHIREVCDYIYCSFFLTLQETKNAELLQAKDRELVKAQQQLRHEVIFITYSQVDSKHWTTVCVLFKGAVQQKGEGRSSVTATIQ